MVQKTILWITKMRNYRKLITSNESFIMFRVKTNQMIKIILTASFDAINGKNTLCKKVCFRSCIDKLLEIFLVCAYIKFNIAQSSSHGVVSFVVCDFSWWKRCCIEENMIKILVVKGSAQHYWHRSFFLPKKPLSITFKFPWFIN